MKSYISKKFKRNNQNSQTDVKVTEVVSKELISSTIDTSIDYGEIVLDDFFEEGILKEIPILKTLVAGTKIVSNIRDKWFIKNLLAFLREVRIGVSETGKMQEFKRKMENDEEYRNKVSETVTVFLEKHVAIMQSKILARLLVSHVEGRITYEEFVDLAICLERLHPRSYDTMFRFALEGKWSINIRDLGRTMPFTQTEEALLMSAGIGARDGTLFRITDLGIKLYENGISYFQPQTVNLHTQSSENGGS